MSVPEWADLTAALDPAWNTALGSLSAAVSMAIITIVSYYFPKDHNKFDEYDYEDQRPRAKRRRWKKAAEKAAEEAEEEA